MIIQAQLEEAKKFLKEKSSSFPKTVVVLGSGLSGILGEMKIEQEIAYEEIPHMKTSTVQGHDGKLVIGQLGQVRVACMKGRLHYYEGYSMQEVVFPFRAFAISGAENFVLTNAAGGIHSDMNPRELVLIRDHINMMGDNPLIGANISDLGPRFPDMTTVYSESLRQIVRECAKEQDVPIREGVYVGAHGPSYETPSEIKAYRSLGADVVGMSTVPEAIALNHMQKKIIGISCVTNLAAGVGLTPLVHEEVLENARHGHDGFARLIKAVVNKLGD